MSRCVQEILETCVRHRDKMLRINIESSIEKRVSNSFCKIYQRPFYLNLLERIEKFYNGEYDLNEYMLYTLQKDCKSFIRGSSDVREQKIIFDTEASYIRSYARVRHFDMETINLLAHSMKDIDPKASKVLYHLDRNLKEEMRYRKTFYRLLKLTSKNVDRVFTRLQNRDILLNKK